MTETKNFSPSFDQCGGWSGGHPVRPCLDLYLIVVSILTTMRTILSIERSNLVRASFLSNKGIDWNHQHHDADASKNGRPEHHPQKIEADADLERRRPDHIDVCSKLHEALGIN